MEISRSRLYELVWSQPLTHIATDLGISDVGLAKICTRLGVPRPGRGHWEKLRHGKVVKQPKLPSSDWPESAFIRERTKPPVVAKPGAPPTVEVPSTLDDAHPLVARTQRALNRGKANEHGRIAPRGVTSLDVAVGEDNCERALRILDGLIRALEARGHPVGVSRDAPQDTYAEIRGTAIRFCLREKLVRSLHQLTIEQEAQELRYGHHWGPTYDFSPSGNLAIQIIGLDGSGARQSWKDSKTAPLEKKLGQVVVGLETAAEIAEAMEREREELHAQWEREWAEREAARRAKDAQEERARKLLDPSVRWQQAERIRRFANAVAARTDQAASWIATARFVADQLDPIAELIDLLDAKPETLR